MDGLSLCSRFVARQLIVSLLGYANYELAWYFTNASKVNVKKYPKFRMDEYAAYENLELMSLTLELRKAMLADQDCLSSFFIRTGWPCVGGCVWMAVCGWLCVGGRVGRALCG